MEKEFDAVQMVRKIRDKLYLKTKRMSSKELIEFYHKAADKINSQRRRSKVIAH